MNLKIDAIEVNEFTLNAKLPRRFVLFHILSKCHSPNLQMQPIIRFGRKKINA
jgi:hypothetical protein